MGAVSINLLNMNIWRWPVGPPQTPSLLLSIVPSPTWKIKDAVITHWLDASLVVTRPARGGKWPHPQHGQIKGVDSGQEKGEETSSAATDWARSAHQWGPHLDGEHYTTGQEGPTTEGLFQEAEGVRDVINAPRSYDSCIVESILTSCRTVWYGSTKAVGCKRPQRVVRSAEKITRPPPPALQSIYPHTVDSTGELPPPSMTHSPQHKLFALRPSGRGHKCGKQNLQTEKNLSSSTRLLNG